MPIRIPKDLPARTILEREHIFMMDDEAKTYAGMRPLSILLLNLMPLKEDTETQLLRAMSHTILPVEVTFMTTATHASTHTSAEHMEKFYVTFDAVKERTFDGMIITGAPIEHYEFEEVDYWPELVEIMNWANDHVNSTLHLCWGAQAALYYFYGIRKYPISEKISGIFEHKTQNQTEALLRGFGDTFPCPHSRHTEVRETEIKEHPELKVLATSEEAGVLLVMNADGSQIFLQGHPEYDRDTLAKEYERDYKKGMDPNVPSHYYVNDDPATIPPLTWRNVATTLYTNWLNYYVAKGFLEGE